jgi:hypothetical protein
VRFFYLHNHRNEVNEGDFVKRGQKIAEMGKCERCFKTHLHFAVWVGVNLKIKVKINLLTYLLEAIGKSKKRDRQIMLDKPYCMKYAGKQVSIFYLAKKRRKMTCPG